MKLSTNINQLWNKRKTHTDENWCTYLFFAALRIVLVFMGTGYLHPDELFQSVEVINGDHFRLEHVRTWEFNNTMPVRSITLPFLLLRVPWSFLEFAALYMREYFNIEILCGYTYLVFPRLIYCILSFASDWALFRVCVLYSLRYEIRLLALSSSWVILVFGTRTFSNTIEMTVCSLVLYFVAECMIATNTIVYKKEFLEEKYDKASSIGERVKIWKLKNALPTHNFNKIFAMSTLCVVGIFNRPTFLLFGAPMVFYWLLRGMGTKSVTFTDFHLRMVLFCLCAIPAILFFVLCDSLYYKYLTSGEIMTRAISIDNFVFTPWNFIKYNLDAKNTAEHGLHPKYIHLLVNVPLLYGILGVIALVSFGQLMIRFFRAEYQGLPRAQSIVGLMSASIFIPLFFLSLINHQEPRFLLPLTYPIILLHGPKLLTGFCSQYPFRMEHPALRVLYEKLLCTKASAIYVLKIWYFANIALTVFFGFIHQAGVIPMAQHFEQMVKLKSPDQNIHLITSHTYMFPLSFVNIPSTQTVHVNPQTGQRFKKRKDFYLYEYGGLDMKQLIARIRLIASHCELKKETKKLKYRLFLAIPSSLTDDLNYALVQSNATYLHYDLHHVFYPHLSTEALPQFLGRHPGIIDPPHWSEDDFQGICVMEQTPELSFSYVSKQLSSFIHQFGLALYEFELKRNVPKSKRTLTNSKCYT
ncbi:phosphatidylinositol glycan anchor biosynthesis class Z [Haematobia irritans]|uniref:phosphatidylinositol glycan anchor biosynthesis class Z n=1 Tax=Haematobia irritans TaxID=7368 RepID=UPI003F50C2FE